MEYNDYQAEVSQLPANQRLTITADANAEALESFKQTRAVSIHFAGHTPDECKVYLGLSMSETSISNYGWNSATNPIAIDCTPVQEQEGTWKIAIASNVSADTWALLSPSLQALTIYVSHNPQMTLATPPKPQVRVTPQH
jgi:hypothetical protein